MSGAYSHFWNPLLSVIVDLMALTEQVTSSGESGGEIS